MASPSHTILLVDDDELVRESMAMMLEALGFVVHTRSSGEAALQSMESCAPDLVILDQNMPGMGGMAALEVMRGQRPELPVILATGRVDDTTLKLLDPYPGVALVPKPFTLQELNLHLTAMLATSP